MKKKVNHPSNCRTIDEVRQEIDRIDREIINLLGNRFQCIKEIVKFKLPDIESIAAKERYIKVIKERGDWAKEFGLDAKIIEKIYQILLDYFIEEQMKILNLKT